MRIRVCYQDNVRIFETDAQQVMIGRAQQGVPVDLDLTPDQAVSRPHARISIDGSQYWIEDLNSTQGTRVSGTEIRGRGRWRLGLGDQVRVGRTTLVVERAPALPEDPPVTEPTGAIEETLDATRPALIPADATADMANRLKLLYDLPLEFAREVQLDSVLQKIVERVVEIVPGAARGALLVKDPTTGDLLLRAHVPQGNPAVSLNLAQRAMEKREAFTWNQGEEEPSASIRLQDTASAMYAPLVWKGNTLGVVCVDNCRACAPFDPGDLKLMAAVAQHAAMAVAVQYVQEDLRQNAVLLSRLLTNFSPKIRTRLLEKARHGQLRLGGEKSEVTILFSDIRDFTRLSAGMEAEDIADMLNSYFPALVEPIFKNDGSIDKFVGDAILAVFGSPEADVQQHEKAVRAAIGMQAAMEEQNRIRQARGQPTCKIGVGVHAGVVLHGFIGSVERMEFTVIGDAVNRASRYCAAANASEILISPEVHRRVWRLVQAEPKMIPTKHEGELEAYRINGMAE
jgi:adenylate cyclase